MQTSKEIRPLVCRLKTNDILKNGESMPNKIRLHIWGDYACFTRPEMKVERVSYDVMTPSAAGVGGGALEVGDSLGD